MSKLTEVGQPLSGIFKPKRGLTGKLSLLGTLRIDNNHFLVRKLNKILKIWLK
jgi:hypothetical protein